MSEADYSDFHKKFLRRVTAKGCLPVQVAQRYFNELKGDFPGRDDLTLETAIQQINAALKLFEQQVVIIKHEQFNEDFVVYSTVAPIPALILQQKLMRPNDFKYFESVLKCILQTEDYQVRYKVALTAESSGRGRSLAGDNEKALEMWISLGYFAVREGIVFLGPKSLVEFKGYIHSEYPDINTCELCFSLTFLNHSCNSCQKTFHISCLDKFWGSMPNTCPACRQHWPKN